MSLKQEIETWVAALGHYDNNEFEEALGVFDRIADTSKILFNCGVINATLGLHQQAVEYYQRAIRLDQYLAVAYFQEGVSNFLMGDFEEALANFNDTLLYLRGNTYIDYDQLGLKFRLYSCEVLFNRGLCYIYLQQEKPGMQDFTYAVKEKMTSDHDVIDDAIRDRADGYTVFSIPVGVVYRPNEAKVKNLKAKDYLGKARLVATSATNNVSTGFQGADRKQALHREITGTDDRPPENISYAATNLVQRHLASRGARDQSAPPVLGRNVFPPTPPPENEKPLKHSSATLPKRTSSMRSSDSRPPLAPYRQDSDVSESDSGRRPSGPTHVPTQLSALAQPSQLQDQPWAQHSASAVQGRPRPSRTASEPRGPPSRRSYDRQGGSRTHTPLYRELNPYQDEALDTCDEVYRMYQSPPPQAQGTPTGMRRPGSARSAALRHQPYIDEEAEYHEEEGYSEGDGMGFDMMDGRHSSNHTPVPAASYSSSTTPVPIKGSNSVHSQQSHMSASRRSDRNEATQPSRGSLSLTKIRVKVHANDDTRYIMVGPAIEYGELESKIREKFSIKSQLRIKMEDDGDMITMADQEDLEMLLSNVRMVARKEKSEMGKMELWIQEIPG